MNVGSGVNISIRELAAIVAKVTGFEGETEWDTSKPDGTPQKLLNVSKLSHAGWTASIGFEDSLRSTVDWYRTHVDELRGK